MYSNSETKQSNSIFQFLVKAEYFSDNAVKVNILKRISRRNSAGEEKTAVETQESLITQDVFHLYKKTKKLLDS